MGRLRTGAWLEHVAIGRLYNVMRCCEPPEQWADKGIEDPWDQPEAGDDDRIEEP